MSHSTICPLYVAPKIKLVENLSKRALVTELWVVNVYSGVFGRRKDHTRTIPLGVKACWPSLGVDTDGLLPTPFPYSGTMEVRKSSL